MVLSDVNGGGDRHTITAPQRRRVREALLRWYAREHRQLPWRIPPAAAGEADTRPDPYHVLVSETMLQQTRVASVVAYFLRFIRAFPTVEALAAADEQHVLRLWQGLGYYRRARHLHAAAGVIARKHGGRVPDRLETLRALPGVGRYTAGAVASIAYGRPAAAVDGNVARVLARLLTIDEPVDGPRERRRLERVAEQLLPKNKYARPGAAGPRRGNALAEWGEREKASRGGASYEWPGDFNQAMMELGARICTPRGPRCSICPVSDWCGAFARGKVERWPVKAAKRPPRAVVHRIVSVRRGDRRLFLRRPEDGLWAGMWEQPTLEGEAAPRNESRPEATSGGRAKASARGLRPWMRRRLGVEVGRLIHRGSFEHRTTHRRIRFEVWEAGFEAGRLRRGAVRWRRIDHVDDLPLANPQHKALRLIAEHRGARGRP